MLTLERVTMGEGGFALQADWQVAAGERVAIIGPSGTGKSTLLMTIAGFMFPADGRILWQGRDMATQAPGDRPVSMLFQDQNLFPHLTVAQNVGLGLSARLRLTPEEEAAAEKSLARVGLSGMGSRKPSQLSGGQISRVALARALLRARPILLLDEPFSALGPAMKEDMLNLVSDVAGETGALVMMVTHDPEDALRFATKTVLVDNGVALPPQPTAELFDAPPPSLRAYLGASRMGMVA